ncbi:hypothetical protein EUGRSUZ_F01490 [Eucalyptus grandis]|uniref:Uncharacterized protein n=2 Tax=Eucalyptus grandis TaxID=71139 RepID=A0ACC3KEP8_EUCGR|nr:hypothetical protein EUGRSUZ_F01490 [Eucalyptus grandis]
MDSLLQDLPRLSGIIPAILVLLIFVFFKSISSSKLKTPPEPLGAWPIIGHLPILAKSKLHHKTLASLADQCGPIFNVRCGTFQALVVSGSEIAKECFTKNDIAVSTRPRYLAQEILGYSYAMFPFAPYGPYWRQVRKMATLELLSSRRLTLNVILRIVAGKRYRTADEEEKQRCQKALREFFHLFGAFLPSDAFPFLRWLDLGGREKAMKRTAEELDEIMGGWLEDHKRDNKNLGETNGSGDFMDVMLSVLNDDEIGGYDADTIIKATCLAMIAGGSDTSMVTLTWAISLLLNNLHSLKKAQKELDAQIGKQRHVKEGDIASLTYLQAIVKETLRLHPAAPLSGPRQFTEDCTVGEYHVPKGTWLILNIWKIQTDPRTWPDPLEFRPERFLSSHKDVDVKDSNIALLPFGGGRRICPGISFGLEMVHFLLAKFLHAFEISTVDNSPVDMSEIFGPTILKATPLEVMLKPRLTRELY